MTIRPGLLALTLLLTLSGQAQAYSYAAAGKEPLIDVREALRELVELIGEVAQPRQVGPRRQLIQFSGAGSLSIASVTGL